MNRGELLAGAKKFFGGVMDILAEKGEEGTIDGDSYAVFIEASQKLGQPTVKVIFDTLDPHLEEIAMAVRSDDVPSTRTLQHIVGILAIVSAWYRGAAPISLEDRQKLCQEFLDRSQDTLQRGSLRYSPNPDLDVFQPLFKSAGVVGISVEQAIMHLVMRKYFLINAEIGRGYSLKLGDFEDFANMCYLLAAYDADKESQPEVRQGVDSGADRCTGPAPPAETDPGSQPEVRQGVDPDAPVDKARLMTGDGSEE